MDYPKRPQRKAARGSAWYFNATKEEWQELPTHREPYGVAIPAGRNPSPEQEREAVEWARDIQLAMAAPMDDEEWWL